LKKKIFQNNKYNNNNTVIYHNTTNQIQKMHTGLLLFLCLATGTASALATKTLFQLKADGSCGNMTFNKPYWMTVAMFIGEALCLPYFYLFCTRHSSPTSSKAQHPINDMSTTLLPSDALSLSPIVTASNSSSQLIEKPKPPCPKWAFLCLCCFDLTASTVNFIGIQWISASLNSMFRGSLVIFVAVFSLFFLRRRLTRGQWGGIGLVTLGLITVGVSSIVDSNSSSNNGSSISLTLLGIFLTILSSALNGLQNVLEEKLMKMLDKYEEPHPMEIVGWEGIFGTILSALIMLPIVGIIPQSSNCGGVVEDSIDTLEMIKDNWLVLVLNLTFIIALGCMNGLSMEIGRVLSAVYRNLVSAVRTISIWLGGIILYYTAGSSYGESVDVYSIIQGGGFALIVAGTIVYSRYKEITLADPNADDGIDALLTTGEVASAPSTFTDSYISSKKPKSSY
jgi:drug/metabolite transporter (DMT)-like permease